MDQILKSVGIDIGTSTTQLVFCAIKIENMAAAWTVPTVRIVDKSIFYKSEIHYTPLLDPQTLDAQKIKDIILKEYKLANLSPKEVDTGAVIITGEAARKENAEEIINMLSDLAGDFVVTTAGPDLEGILAGKGSGAYAYSLEHMSSVVNFDIGGGTTNVAVFKNGEVIDSACFDIGGRLIKLDANQKVTYLSKKMKTLITKMNLNIEENKIAESKDLKAIAKVMADAIIQIIHGKMDDPYVQILITDHGLRHKQEVRFVSISGGVADCFFEKDEELYRYGDIGILLGQSLQQVLMENNISVIEAKETIRATVIGAGIHTTNISGSTIHYDSKLLPLKNIPVVKLSETEEESLGQSRIEAIERRVQWAIHDGIAPLICLALNGSRRYGFDALQSLAEDIINGLHQIVESKEPIIIAVEQDMAKALGLSLKRNLSQEKAVICIDSIHVDNGDYVDIGTPVAEGQVLPVIIKSLLFSY